MVDCFSVFYGTHIISSTYAVISVLQPDYNLLITGHSLGAGVAAILAFLMREKYPNLYCYSFSPPGGLLRWE